jgi:hypothetical protein
VQRHRRIPLAPALAILLLLAGGAVAAGEAKSRYSFDNDEPRFSVSTWDRQVSVATPETSILGFDILQNRTFVFRLQDLSPLQTTGDVLRYYELRFLSESFPGSLNRVSVRVVEGRVVLTTATLDRGAGFPLSIDNFPAWIDYGNNTISMDLGWLDPPWTNVYARAIVPTSGYLTVLGNRAPFAGYAPDYDGP